MNQYITGATIRDLREKKGYTQAKLAELLLVSDKAISRWETGKGYPDITLLQPLAKALDISVAELLSGNPIVNANVIGNMLRSKIYVCPICGNIVYSMGETVVHCHGIQLASQIPEPCDERHRVTVEIIEDEYYVTINHDMTKSHYILFIAAMSQDRLQLVKLYPEGSASARVKISGVKRILLCCNRDGLYYTDFSK